MIDATSRAGSWLRVVGPEGDYVLSTRMRLARNVAGEPFSARGDADQLSYLRDRLVDALSQARGPVDAVVDLAGTSANDREVLRERHLISRELAEGEAKGRAVVYSSDENFSVMINEEDHLRMQLVRPGLALHAALDGLMAFDDHLAHWVDYSFDSQFGFLTACPTNCGTGLRASVMLHLPALTYRRHIDKVFRAVNRVNLVVRGLYGEGTKPLGCFYQISNQVTLGRSEKQLIEDLLKLLPRIIEYERRMRETLIAEDRFRLEDRIWRAYGLLKSARIISSEETMELLSDIRLGVNLGFINNIEIPKINELFVLTQPAHLQQREGTDLDATARDEHRARFVRDRLLAAEN